MAKKDPLKGVPQITEKKLNSLLGTARKAYKDGRSIAGDLGEKIKTAKEHDHLHTKAFGTIRQMDRMEAEDLARYWHTLNLYMDQTGMTDKIDSVPSLKLVHDADAKEEPQTEAAE